MNFPVSSTSLITVYVENTLIEIQVHYVREGAQCNGANDYEKKKDA